MLYFSFLVWTSGRVPFYFLTSCLLHPIQEGGDMEHALLHPVSCLVGKTGMTLNGWAAL